MTVLNTNIHDLLITNKPDFSDKKLEYFDDKKFLEENPGKWGDYYTGSAPLNKVVGTTHSDYDGYSWMELLPTAFKSEQNITNFSAAKNLRILKREHKLVYWFQENPDYYLSEEKKENMSFFKVGDKFYINGGNHRVVMARFFLNLNQLPEVIKGVTIEEFIVAKSLLST